MSDPYIRFTISEGYFPNIYEGNRFNPDQNPTYGMTIKAEELPDDLHPFGRPWDKDGVFMVSLRSKIAPVVIVEGGDGSTTFRCARDANLRLDLLFTKVPLELCVEHVAFEASRPGRHPRGETVDMLVVRAIRIQLSDLIRRYDELCAEYFTMPGMA